MEWFDNLKAQFPGIKSLAEKPGNAKANKHPRDALCELIKNSIAVLHNPEHTVTKRKKKPYKPEVCFTAGEEPGKTAVALTYCREPLTLPDGSKALEVELAQVEPLLLVLQAAVKAKHFDDQLQAIKDARVTALKAKKSKKAA